MTFKELNLSQPLLRAVSEVGYTQPSPIQGKAIPPVLEGRDLLGCAQTGTGKTAAFALPMLHRLAATPARKEGAVRALILTPTRELALQIGESFSDYGKYLSLRHTVIFGGVGQQPQIDILRRGVDILVACPGRLNDLVSQGHVDLSNVEIFVLDEADQMLDMGFIRDVRRVMRQLPPKTERQTLLFSATMPKEIEQLAEDLLNEPAFVKVDPVSSTVDRIQQSLYYVEKGNKKLLLPYLIQHLDPPVTNALVFSRTKYGADKIAKDLTKRGIPAAAIHGNKSQNARVTALEDFKSGKTRVLVATDIAARGIDISELAYVFNYDLPEVPETYVHRIGRTARAGADGYAVSFCAPEETEYLAGIEKLNRKKIPVVSGHPWDGVPAPVRTLTAAAQAAAKPKKTRGAKPEQTITPKPERNEELTMEEKQQRKAPQGEKLSASAKRRRRRNKSAAAQQPATTEKAAPQNKKRAPARREKTPGAPAQPKFDPHFLSAAAVDQAQGIVQAKKETRAERPEPKKPQQPKAEKAPARSEKQPRNQQAKGNGKNQPKGQPKQQPKREKAAAQPRAERPEPKKSQPKAEPRRQRAPREENPGLILISRRPPQQKFANFDDYMEAHGGVTAPVEDYADE